VRHSIWQNVLHMVFWREANLDRLTTGKGPGPDEVKRLNFPAPEAVTVAAWEEAKRRLGATHERVAGAIADPNVPLDRISYLLPHDCYHFGQINYLRGMLGLAPIE
jgi:hypothetical protein